VADDTEPSRNGGLSTFLGYCVYLYETDQVPEYNTNDFQDFEWLTPQELLAKLENGEPAKSSMLSTVQAVFNKLIV
jgi:hypothetical protein